MSLSSAPIEPAPRPLTSAASRAAWREADVRVVLLIAMGFVVAILAVGVRQMVLGIGDRILLHKGVLVQASIDNIDGANRNVDRSVQRYLTLSFTLPGDPAKHTVKGFSTPMPGMINQHDIIPLRVDPNDVNNWTERAEPIPWLHAMLVPLLLSPIALLLVGVAALRRRAFTSIYRDGATQVGNVRGVQRSALVPGQRIVRVVVAGGDGRVIQVTVPAALAPAEDGATIELLAHGPGAGRAIAAAAYR